MIDYTLYILMRNDLPSMNPGRAMAQASHASNAFINAFGNRKTVKSWQKQTLQGFGTAIVLSVDYTQLKEKCCQAVASGFPSHYVTDPDYVVPISSEIIPYIDDRKLSMFIPSDDGRKYFFHRSEITCAYIFGSKEELRPILEELPLHP